MQKETTGKDWLPDITLRFKTREKVIYLTFDDGPVPEVTPWVLDQLRAADARATFFCLGKNVENHPELFIQLIKEGHRTGNHSYSHPNGLVTPAGKYHLDVLKAAKLISSDLFRPPYGKILPRQYQLLKNDFRIILWDVLSRDYNYKLSKEKCLAHVLGKTKPGSILVFHDSVKAWKNLEYVLPKILDHFSQKGFSFRAIP
jgi:peptidoglycan-N-acetylglucosamine deacetylase